MKLKHLILLLLSFSFYGLRAASLTKFAIQQQYLMDEYNIRGSEHHEVTFKTDITISRALKSYGYEKINWIITVVSSDNYHIPMSKSIQITESDFPNNTASLDITIDCTSTGIDPQVRVQMEALTYDDLGNLTPEKRNSRWSSQRFDVSGPFLTDNPPVNIANANLYSSYAPSSNFRKSDYITGGALTFGQSDWANTQGITSLNGSLYVVQANNLHKVNSTDGSYIILGQQQIWKATEAVASSSNGSIYIIQNSRIHKVNPSNGQYSIIGNPEWANTDCLTAYNGYLYIVENNHLYKVNENTGTYTELNSATWGGAKGIASTNDGYIWIVQNGYLHKISTATGEWQSSQYQQWSDAPKGCLAYYNGNLYALKGPYLVKVSIPYLSWDEISYKTYSGCNYLTGL
ncbi:hypothetical protein [Pedobacter cryoconitis]|uniref:Uncharacterized protein n=1 Tax=Pedobacter cryoconitis TaxID=188932 RepID=A0A7X0J0J7_9SPHI|nr:hypothetical protein [Pedobacter cryoconitis]MBB6498854.1 hypothetical protein [Pedobacter cryoconitis]